MYSYVFSVLIDYYKLTKLKIETYVNNFAIKYKLSVRGNQITYQNLKYMRGNLLIS